MPMKKHRRHVDLFKRVNQGQRPLFIRLLATMDQLSDHPENAETEKYSHKGWQVRDGLEGGHCDQQAQA